MLDYSFSDTTKFLTNDINKSQFFSNDKLTTEPPISSGSVSFCSNFAFLLVPVRHIELLSVQKHT